MMNILVVGCGSIGQRHIENLQFIDAGDISIVEPHNERREYIQKKYGIEAFIDIGTGLNNRPDVCLICTPTRYHIDPAIEAAKKGCDIFIEKPLSDTMEDVGRLESLVLEQKLISMIACNMRFHQGISSIKDLITRDYIGNIYAIRAHAGHYLPAWHPKEDYRKSYSARREMGGGVILDGIHEIDLLRWFFGDVEELFCYSGKCSDLAIDTEDIAAICMKFRNGVLGELHLDYLQRIYGRGCQIIGEKGTITWDFTDNCVKAYSIDNNSWNVILDNPSYDINRMYIDEMKYFIDCVRTRKETMNNIKEGAKTLLIALNSKKSSQMKEVIKIG